MTKPKIGDIIKYNGHLVEEDFLVLSCRKKNISLGHPFVECKLLKLEDGKIINYHVFYDLKGWIKVA